MYRLHRHNDRPHRLLWQEESTVSGATRRAQYSINSATDAPALIITPFTTSSNNVTDPASFGGPSSSHGWEDGMPRPRQPSTRYPKWQRPALPLLPTLREEAHAQAPPSRYQLQPPQVRPTPVPSLSDHSCNNALSPQIPRTPGTPSPSSAVSATSTTPLTHGGPVTPMLDWGYHAPRRPEPAVVANPMTTGPSSLPRPVSAGLGDTSQRPFSEVSTSIPYLIEPLSPNSRSPALIATSPIDTAYAIQPSALSALQADKMQRAYFMYGPRSPQLPGLQPPGPVVEPSSPSLGTRRASQPTLTPPSSAGVLQYGSSPNTPTSRTRVAEARERQDRARWEREEETRSEQMRSVTTGVPAKMAKGLEARDARLKATDNMRDILDALDEQKIDTVNRKESRGKKKGLKRPKGMSIDTRMGEDVLRGKKSPGTAWVSTPMTSESLRPPPTAGIPMDIEPGSPPARGLSDPDNNEMGPTAKPRKLDRKGTDEDHMSSWPLDALQSRYSGFWSANSSPLTSAGERGYSTTGRPSPMSARSGALTGLSRVDVPSSSPVHSPLSPNMPSAGLATPSWLQSTFMSLPQSPLSAGVPSPTPGMQNSEPVSIRPMNVRRLPTPQARPESSSTPGSASFAPIMEAQDPRFTIVDPPQAIGTDRRRGGIDASRMNTPLPYSPSAVRRLPTPVQTSARTAQAGESGWF